MYRNNFRRGGARRQKTFDPTNFIKIPKVERPIEEELVIANKFSDFDILPELKRNIEAKGYRIPTPVQDKAIPAILEGRDLIGIANTGTGKTAAFLIPLIDQALKDPSKKTLIITPTRELANQIRDEFYGFSRGLNIYSALLIGGSNMYRQINDLRRRPNFVIGTPGRIEDMIRSRYLNLSDFTSIVLDEADHMVDIGFIQNVRFIVSLLPRNRQSLFFSATIDGKVREILLSFVQNPVTVSVKTGETAENVKQEIINMNSHNDKIEVLHEILIQKESEKVLVFGRTKYGVQDIADELVRRGFKADAIHGNRNQNQRIRTLERFKRNEVQILVATDVASRGLDIPNVSHVINYDLPESLDTYIHRIGRTGRADKKGTAITFVV